MTTTTTALDNHCKERVHTHQLADIVNAWIERNDADRNKMNVVKRASKMSGIQYICMEANVQPRRLYSILHKESKSTGFWLADRILAAIRLSHLLDDGTIEVWQKQ